MLAATSAAGQIGSPPDVPPLAQVPRRKFGRHDDQVSILGIGGYHLGLASSHEEAMRIVGEALDSGVNFFDNAWEYNEHRSEEWMGDALRAAATPRFS